MENFINNLADMNWGWWPFVSLKPAQDEKMTNALVAKMALYFGTFYGIIFYLITMGSLANFNIIKAILFLVYIIIFFFVGYRVTFAYFWNKRADRLRSKE
ncbi:MAG: hypothetical protein WAU60_05945 [Candidatus Competibacter denitrificans]|jgi:uncharacterized membrane protein|uniref:Transmembrane protein n=1 Tax=Candidatus Competibacter denitrificans Run_A_D11 TaxID=1400863 RepID=W6MED1_9GAMM|nr:hypothetical protein [Candidatus Competibacter denitrificans]CDI04403.1 hypothetical protein BN873_980004 [Candidatus Competibacter denitrificans Run_A_D11]HRC70282.1 hypothetical protein [Candidatus Competibacter denitrificans]